MGSKQLAIGMTEQAVKDLLGSSVRTGGKSPQGFTTLAYNTSNYSEYLLIYLKDSIVVGICGIGKSMSYDTAVAGQSGSTLSGWTGIGGYKVGSNYAAKQKTVSASELAYAFYDALGDNSIYCIQVFDPTKLVNKDKDMIFKTENLSYNADVTQSIATEIGHMLCAFRVYKGKAKVTINSKLASCAQAYCNKQTGKKITSRDADTLDAALAACGIVPNEWAEGSYYGAADAVSAFNSLIKMSDFYTNFMDTKYKIIGVGMAATSSGSYVIVDYIDEV